MWTWCGGGIGFVATSDGVVGWLIDPRLLFKNRPSTLLCPPAPYPPPSILIDFLPYLSRPSLSTSSIRTRGLEVPTCIYIQMFWFGLVGERSINQCTGRDRPKDIKKKARKNKHATGGFVPSCDCAVWAGHGLQ